MASPSKFVPDSITVAQQRKASNPNNSAWVSANAGAGKTYVLSRRVVRLLLQGTDPSRILCLTFTKAAAGEMSNRVFEILGNWATLPRAELVEELTATEGKAPTQQQLDIARTLFARALETPGGLKIQTIHAFCEALLHQFPLEANVPGHFSVMGDGEQAQLMAEARRSVILESNDNPKSAVAIAFSEMMAVASDKAIEDVFDEIISKRDELAVWLRDIGGAEAAEKATKQRHDFTPEDTVENLRLKAVANSGFDKLDLAQLARVCIESGQDTMVKLAGTIQSFVESANSEEKLELLDKILFTTGGEIRKFGRYPTKFIHEAMPNVREAFAESAVQLEGDLLRIKTFILIELTTSMLVVAEAVINRYRQAKRGRGYLDFDDLVARTADLLTVKEASRWVLYKLDLGIDHILLDEAQDTSPRQWQIIAALVEEFFVGESSRSLLRTVFAVGDEKQSIYSFQGAEPKSFNEQRQKFKGKANRAERLFEDVGLNVSFRSTQAILSAVDKVFSLPQNFDGLTSETSIPNHIATRKDEPGSVEIWPLVSPQEAEPAPDWHTPQSQADSAHQAIKLAQKIADQVKQWVGNERIEASGKLITAGDVLVLVRARDRFMVALNRALKDRGIAVAGADRLALTNHIAVQDLIALGQIMLTPEDDLSLAAILKSPLIGLDEDQLYELARSRLHEKYETSLFEALATQEAPAFVEAYQQIIAWRNRVDVTPSYEFYAQLLGADGGRKKFYARLGQEAEDVLDAFLDLTLSHEQAGLPGLQSFLESLVRDAPEIKREMDQSAGQVRVMTVHAAKGLEAPIVFLVDKSSPAYLASHASPIYHWHDEAAEGYVWVPRASDHGTISLPLKEQEKLKSEQEFRRLLYVGMTRAKDKLIVCGYRGTKTPSTPNWHSMVSLALEDEWEDVLDKDGNLFCHRWQEPDRKAGIVLPIHHEDEAKAVEPLSHDLPAWVGHQLPKEVALPRPLAPSGAQALIDESTVEVKSIPSLLLGYKSPEGAEKTNQEKSDGENPRLRGTVIHRLLQVLPDMKEEERWALAENYLARSLPKYSNSNRAKMLEGVRKAMSSSMLAPYLDPLTSRAEVPIMGQLELAQGARPVSGTIDRLAVLEDEVMLIDYKTSPRVPDTASDVPRDYVTQMALYRALVVKLYPNMTISSALVWTHAPNGPVFMKLPDEALDAAYANIAQL